jgi:hypothetical protein
MLPSAEAIQTAYAFLARRYHVQERLRDGTVRAALRRAHQLAQPWPPRDETAALFYALASRGRALGRLRHLLATTLAVNHAQKTGHWLDTSRDEIYELFETVAADRTTFADVRTWFAERLRPRT